MASSACSRSRSRSRRKPRVLLLDEPAAGVPESERHDILAAVAAPAARRHGAADRARHGSGVLASPTAFRCWSTARMLVEGPPAEVARDPRVKAVYLGEAADA